MRQPSRLDLRVWYPRAKWWSSNEHRKNLHMHRHTAAWRKAARESAAYQLGFMPGWRPLDVWTVEVRLAWGDRHSRDPDNYANTVVKAVIDGLVPEVATADDSRHRVFTSYARHPDDRRGFDPGVYLTIREV